MKLQLALALPPSLLAGTAAAGYPDHGGFLDAYYIPTSKKDVNLSGLPEHEFSGDGFGVHGVFPVGPLFIVTGEYQRNSHDDRDTDSFRVGGGVQSSPDKARLLATADYVNINPPGKGHSSGFGLHLRGTFDVMPQLNIFGEIGYINISASGDSIDGPEFLFGAAFAFTELIGAFVDYRITRLAAGNEDKVRFDDLRTGVRIFLTH